MTPEKLAALKEVATAAHATGPMEAHGNDVYEKNRKNRKPVQIVTRPDHDGIALAAYIATFNPTTCLELLEEVERLRKLTERMSK
jgi:hypothetical protein